MNEKARLDVRLRLTVPVGWSDQVEEVCVGQTGGGPYDGEVVLGFVLRGSEPGEILAVPLGPAAAHALALEVLACVLRPSAETQTLPIEE